MREVLKRFNEIAYVIDKIAFAKIHFPKAYDKFFKHTWPAEQTGKNLVKMINEIAE